MNTRPTLSKLGAIRSAAVALTAVALLAGCVDEAHLTVTLPENANEVRLRSVRVQADRCVKTDGSYTNCSEIQAIDQLRVEQLRGVNGAPVAAVELDKTGVLEKETFSKTSAYWVRLPIGHGCETTLQGLFRKAGADLENIANYQRTAFEQLLGEVRSQGGEPLWTVGYGLGTDKDGKLVCEYENKEQKGTPITDAKTFAKVVRRLAKYYDRDLPEQKKKEDIACTADLSAGEKRPWYCGPTLFNIEFGRDHFGAGGMVKSKDLQTWLDAYTELWKELRQEFPWPANSVRIIGPSVVLNGQLSIANPEKTNPNRSPLFDFIDYVASNKAKGVGLSMLSFEVIATSAQEAYTIVAAVREYADKQGLKNEDDQPIPLFVTDLRLDKANLSLPDTLKNDPVRFSAYEGVFYAGTKMLLQGAYQSDKVVHPHLVTDATVGRVVRFPTMDPAQATAKQVAENALPSDLIWYGDKAAVDPTLREGDLKPAAWHAFWFHESFLGGGGGKLTGRECVVNGKDCVDARAEAARKGLVKVEYGPDALALSGTKKSTDTGRFLIMATRESCVDAIGAPVDCVTDHSFPAVTVGRKRMVRVMVADYDVDNSSPNDKEVLEHHLRLQVDGIPADAQTVGFRWARMNGILPTWKDFSYPDQGLLQVSNGSFNFDRPVAVPSLHYFEFLF